MDNHNCLVELPQGLQPPDLEHTQCPTCGDWWRRVIDGSTDPAPSYDFNADVAFTPAHWERVEGHVISPPTIDQTARVIEGTAVLTVPAVKIEAIGAVTPRPETDERVVQPHHFFGFSVVPPNAANPDSYLMEAIAEDGEVVDRSSAQNKEQVGEWSNGFWNDLLE